MMVQKFEYDDPNSRYFQDLLDLGIVSHEELKDYNINYKNATYGDVLAAVLKNHFVDMCTGVTGGGTAKEVSYFQKWRMKISNAHSEPGAAAEMLGSAKTRKKLSIPSFYSTHYIGFVQAVGMLSYLFKKANSPAIMYIGANADGEITPDNFQNGNPEDYRAFFKENMFVVTADDKDPNKFLKRIFDEFIPMVRRCLIEGKQMAISMPYNMTSEKLDISWPDHLKLREKPNLEAKELTSENISQLKKMFDLQSQENSRTLYVPGPGLSHANRLREGRPLEEFKRLTEEKLPGHIMAAPDNADLLWGSPLELAQPFHVYDQRIQDVVKKCNVLAFFGGGPHAAITGNKAGIDHYRAMARMGKFFMIDPDSEKLAEWKKAFPGVITIQADTDSAAKYLSSLATDQFQAQEKYNILKQDAADLKAQVWEGNLYKKDEKGKDTEERNYAAEAIRDVQKAIAAPIEKAKGRSAVLLDSGNSPNGVMKFFNHDNPNLKIFYPEEGMLGVVASAAIGAIKSAEYDKVTIITGDGGAGYISARELAIIHRFAKENKVAVNLLVLENGGHLSVEASFPLGLDRKEIKDGAYDQTPVEQLNYHKMSKIIPGVRSTKIKGEPEKITKAMHKSSDRVGLNITQIDISGIQSIKKPLTNLVELERKQMSFVGRIISLVSFNKAVDFEQWRRA